MQNSPAPTGGNSGTTRSPERLVNSDGITTSARKLRCRQVAPGFRATRVDFLVRAPFSDACRTTRTFFAKRIGTGPQHIVKPAHFKRFCACGRAICVGNRIAPKRFVLPACRGHGKPYL